MLSRVTGHAAHSPVRDWNEPKNVDAHFAVCVDVHMRRFVIIRVMTKRMPAARSTVTMGEQ